ncbi:MAG: hypothetical protein V4506_19160 [Bacteroidota bacterium]
MINRVYTFENGTKVDLARINSIAPIDKDLSGNIFIPVYYEKSTKPVKYQVGFSIGEASEVIKNKCHREWILLTGIWETYKNKKE